MRITSQYPLRALLSLAIVAISVWDAAAQAPVSANLPPEYLKNLKNYQFVNTRGMRDLSPNRHPWLDRKYNDPDSWELPDADELKRLEEMGIPFPDFSFITDPDTVAEGQTRQRTHTIEHVLYALPGDALSLYPYYGLEEMKVYKSDKTDIESTKGFLETFSHWYDFHDGGRVLHHSAGDGKTYDLLDFPSCRGYMQMSDSYGFYGGIYMSPEGAATGPTFNVSTTQEYIDAVKAINDAGGKGTLLLTADLDFDGVTGVPMLGDNNGHRFSGTFNGQGHRISNLTISEWDGENVGLIRTADDGARICNLIIDSTCTFEGRLSIGLIGQLNQGTLTVKNVVMNAKVRGLRDEVGEQFASAILGRAGHDGSDNRLIFEDIYLGGTVGNYDKGIRYDTALCGWLNTKSTRSTSIFKNITVNATVYGPESLDRAYYLRRDLGSFKEDIPADEGRGVEERHADYSIIYTDCYGNLNAADPCWTTFDTPPVHDGWQAADTPGFSMHGGDENLGAPLTALANAGHRPWNDGDQERRKAGTSAVFYFPDNEIPDYGKVGKEFLSDRDEYVIAADFSQTFEPGHIDVDAMTVKEPLVAFRHIFRIRNGMQQAEELREHNRRFIRRHQHKVTARTDANFQIRLDFPLPTNWGKAGGVTNYYYEKAAGNYDRVKYFGLRVLDGDTRDFKYDLGDGLPAHAEDGFELGADIRMRRATASADRSHAEALDEMFDYHTMLLKPATAGEAHFIVQVMAKDDAGNFLQSTDGDMVLMEYDITFLPEEGASLITHDKLYSDDKFTHAREEYMTAHYGAPEDAIDFDAYFALNRLDESDLLRKKMISYSVIRRTKDDGLYEDFPVWAGTSDYRGGAKTHHSFFKWPLPWRRSGYSFGYNYRYDYNMYMLTTHSENVPYHAQADEFVNPDGSRGLYDRLYYETQRLHKADPRVKVEQGYYYYVNAASDPGVSARLNFDITCPGSRVIVSAWVAELSPAEAYQDEPANLSFNFVAVMKETGERVTLHNFITGYLGDKNIYNGTLKYPGELGQWLNVYYSFVPRMSEFYEDIKTFDNVDHFELELAHNGRSSAGSDYAIDDIRAYVVPPYSKAAHDGYACDDSPLAVNVDTSFETLLEKSGVAEAFDAADGETLELYYAFADKDIADDPALDPESAFVSAFVEEDSVAKYGKITFSSCYRSNLRYKDLTGDPEEGTAYHYTDENGDRLIRFVTTAAAGALHPGKEYYVVFRSAGDGETPEADDLTAFFDLCGQCRYNCSMSVRSSLRIKLDGVLQPESETLSVCENQQPVLQINVWSTDKDPVEVVKNAWFDWFDGTLNEFSNYRFVSYPASLETVTDTPANPGEARTLRRALEVFRMHHSDAAGTMGIVPAPAAGAATDALEQWMLDIIDVATEPDAAGRVRLWLRQASYVVPPVDLPAGTTAARAKAVAIPITDLYPSGYSGSVCSSPAEVSVEVTSRTPMLRHGLTAIDYPADMADVPLRVGLSQLRRDNAPGFAFTKKGIDMPIRLVASSDGKDRSFSVSAASRGSGDNVVTRERCLLLVQTDDPEYRDLGTLDSDGNETGALLWVGEISRFRASAAASAERDYFMADFDRDFHIKEGYFYRLRFGFDEEGDTEIEAGDVKVCQGQDVFTLKIVPEYMRWTADRNLSWDNDANWRRIPATELAKDEADADDIRFSDGASANLRGYAPLSFTKVLLAAPELDSDGKVKACESPWLYAARSEKVGNDYEAGKTLEWSADPSPHADDISTDRIGNPTALIQFDMAAYEDVKAAPGTVRCRPWTANSCDEIHFLPGATLMNQQCLAYSRAWVDIELDHSRWYLLSSPLKHTYAGDFYLPTMTGRQNTEIFQPITFDKELHDRFAPAVYQRGWDKGEARVYEFGEPAARNAAVKTFWSHVYNDVAEEYGGGAAFSIKTDVSRLADAPEKVMFRLPKADITYSYYTHDGDTGHDTDLAKTESGRLNDATGTLTSTTANPGRYFMIGNPFMTWLDIRGLLEDERNADEVEPRYWLVTENGLIAASLSDDGTYLASAVSAADVMADPTALAPMQGLFVKAKSDRNSLSLHYDESMMRRNDAAGNALTECTRGRAEMPLLRVTAGNAAGASSAATMAFGPENESAATEAFDLRELGVASTVFFGRGGHARSIDFCEDAEGIEIGLIADDFTETILAFESAPELDGLLLLDKATDTVTPLAEIDEIAVKGPVSGRFFLTRGCGLAPARDGLRWRMEGNILKVDDPACTGLLRATVYDLPGRVVADVESHTDSLALPIGEGIYVVKMGNACEEKIIKICR